MGPKSKDIFNWLVLAGMIFSLPLLYGCQEDTLPDGEGAEVLRLNQIPDNPDYASLDLIGTQWQLAGFVNGNRIRPPQAPGRYTLTFRADGIVSGRTAVNLTHGSYTLANKQLLVSDFRDVTEAAKFPDDDPFIEAMNTVFSYQISTKGLALNYGRQKYLLFKPGETNNSPN